LKSYFGVRWPYWAAFIAIAAWGGISTYRRATKLTYVLATTSCPLRGEPKIVIAPGVDAEDSIPVRVHEEVHAAQCRRLGAVNYWLSNVTARGKLSLEAPAYCAAAEARLRAGMDPARVASRLRDDIVEAMSDVADSATAITALRTNCAGIVDARSSGARR
jgi:hypothetical protein